MIAGPFIAKLERFVRLAADERTALFELAQNGTKKLGQRQDLVRNQDKPRSVNLIADGWACRSIDLSDGRRQIVAILLPGDVCDLGMSYLQKVDHTITALSQLTVAEIPFDKFEALRRRSERLDIALQWNAMVEVATARQWIVNTGQRSAVESIAHLFCELRRRLTAVGAATADSFEFPLTQLQLGEATGLSSVHVNRSLQWLRSQGLIVLRDRTLTVPDAEALEDIALFDAAYLHLEREGQKFDAPY